jgi:HSP20 family protein
MTNTNKGNGAVAVQEKRPARLLAWPEELERYFDRRFGQFPLRLWRRPETPEAWLPDLDVFEKDGQLVIRTDIPGMTPDNINVSVEGDVLTIKGKREEEKEVKEEDYYCSERATGEFYRTIRLPEGVKADAFEAHYDKGVLEVTVPRPSKAEAKAVKVEVK